MAKEHTDYYDGSPHYRFGVNEKKSFWLMLILIFKQAYNENTTQILRIVERITGCSLCYQNSSVDLFSGGQ
jgi:hypothetical protein